MAKKKAGVSIVYFNLLYFILIFICCNNCNFLAKQIEIAKFLFLNWLPLLKSIKKLTLKFTVGVISLCQICGEYNIDYVFSKTNQLRKKKTKGS